MPTKQHFEKKSLTALVFLCEEVANDPANYTQAGAAEASNLKREWVALQTAADKTEQGKEETQLTARMAEFLERIGAPPDYPSATQEP